MKRTVHLVADIAVKRLIVLPGLFILVPALAAAGGSGFALARDRRGALVQAKKRRMPFIALNGLRLSGRSAGSARPASHVQ